MSTKVTQGTGIIEVLPIGGRVGATVQGVKLGGELDAEVIQSIREALLKHKVLFFRDQQHLDDAKQEDFADLLGEPFAHPTVKIREGSRYILELDSHQGGRANAWHTDITFIDAYPSISVLRSVVVPASGGDTVWSNTAAAYDSLPQELKDLAEKLWAVHTNLYDYAARRPEASEERVKEYQRTFASTVYETEHPLVRVHPETGEKSLLLGSFVKRLLGVSAAESARLYELFQQHVTSLENTVRWHWAAGDVAIWDNRSTQHIAVNDYGDQHRIVRRVTLAGEVPVSVDGRQSTTYLKTPNVNV
ncbi:TauD/TfdA family dioxygenase [Paenibacillus sp. JCM 10914]|uniref:TauD/TfdA dioxygenase family protein n=1 Tax=Paenibacillus sp. JCM 10914 TaxID=1236974 RepID=UPI0003CC94C9|nr:TauD/TfdA family dioxygenase [Paenibacillus sp. JCM 10914]GAE05765.1 alpha-ketoglutarate-dependent taurine dioxygenase [Paenibacillus sp. JCM 10914]